MTIRLHRTPSRRRALTRRSVDGALLNVLQVGQSVAEATGGPAVGSVALNRALNRQSGLSSVLLSYPDLLTESEERDLQCGTGRFQGASVTLSARRPALLTGEFSFVHGLWTASRKADVIHIHGFYTKSAVMSVLIARLHRIPVVIQAHGVFEAYQQRQSRLKKRFFNLCVGHLMLKYCDFVLVASESEAQNAHFPNNLKPPIVVMPLAAESDVEQIASEREAQSILFMGRIVPKKNVLSLVDAFKLVSERAPLAVLTIAGRDANGILNGHLADLAPELRGRIRVVGHVSGVAKAAILASHELFVLPSDNENFGIAAVEAAYAGLRVITTMEVASGVLLAARSLATLLPGTEATTISRTILDELRRPWLSDERETRASAAKRLFSWDATARQLLLVYERLTP